MRQLTLFIMITQLPDNILNRIARHILTTAPDSSQSWFIIIRNICFQYFLPHPLLLLQYPPKMDSFKETAKLKIKDFWRKKLTEEASLLSSLRYFKPQFMSLDKPHPIWTSCSGNVYEVQKAVIQSRMLSGRYRDDRLARHFTSNTSGCCLLCQNSNVPHPPIGDLTHFLLHCPSLHSRRLLLASYWLAQSENNLIVRNMLVDFQNKPDEYKLQFLLDCSTLLLKTCNFVLTSIGMIIKDRLDEWR